MEKHIYADNAATTALDSDAFEAMKPFLLDQYANVSQPYSFARLVKRAVQESRERIASCIGALPEEIFFTSGGTESDNWAIKGTSQLNVDKCAIVTSSFEHHAVLHSCQAMEGRGIHVTYMRPTKDGFITPGILRDHIAEDTFLVSVMFANNEIGTVQPIKQLCAIAHTYGSLFHTDAVQAVGHIPIQAHELDVDMLSASAHKFNGPKGVGFLYIKRGTSISPYANGGAQESGIRAGTENVAGIVGMAAALKQNCDSMQQHIHHIEMLELELIGRLNQLGVSYVRNGGEHRLPGLINLSFPNADGEAILHRMDLLGICISTGSACNSQSREISHVLQAIGVEDNYAKGTIRISLGKTNTVDDIDAIVKAIVKIVGV